MYLYGTGGIAVVAAEVLANNRIDISRFYDDDPNKTLYLGRRVSAGIELNPELILPDDEEGLICIGNNERRRELIQRLSPRLGAVFHSSALISPSASIGTGTMIFHGSKVQAQTRIGNAVIVNTGASIDHDCEIGDYAHIAPNVTLCGYVNVGEGANIGAASVVIPGVKIGKWATLGAGATVVNDIPDYALAVGCPARVIKRRPVDYVRTVNG